MTPEVVAAVFITFVLCAVAAYVLLMLQAGRYEIQLATLRRSVHREAGGRRLAEGRLRDVAGEDEWEQREFWSIAAELGSEEGL